MARDGSKVIKKRCKFCRDGIREKAKSESVSRDDNREHFRAKRKKKKREGFEERSSLKRKKMD